MDKWCEVASQPGAVQLDGCPVYTTRLLRRVRGRGSVQRGEADAANSVDQHGHRLTRRVGILVLHAALFSERNTLLITGAGSYTINHATDDDVPAAAGLIRSLEFTPLLSLSLSLALCRLAVCKSSTDPLAIGPPDASLTSLHQVTYSSATYDRRRVSHFWDSLEIVRKTTSGVGVELF